MDRVNQSSEVISQPVAKRIAEVVTGILGSGSLQLSMVVVRHGKQQPMVLVSTERIRGRLQGERLIQSYMGRWACEEGYRFSKQGFGLEKVQARKLTTLQNLVALATLAWGLLACHQNQGQKLIYKAKRQKSHKPLVFPFYTLLSDWQALKALSG